jgi:osmoprotectant transport system permease protein
MKTLVDFFNFLNTHRSETGQLLLEHLFLVVIATGAAVAVGVPVGILLTRKPALSKPVLGAANILQTVPSLALFGFLIPILGRYGIGQLPAIIALFLYSLLPIIRNTFTGITGVDPAVKEAARGMGMTDWQMLTQVELPLAMSVIIAGIRVATVISVGTATIAAAIGAGGLGTYIFRGLRMNDNALVLAGAAPAAVMALVADFALGWLEKSLVATGRASSGKRVKLFGRETSLARIGVVTIVIVASAVALFSLRRSSDGPADSKDVAPGRSGEVVVGSKDFTEQVILGEMAAQLIEARTGLRVKRQFELGGDLCHRAMIDGNMDCYVEYTGTAFTAILKHDPVSDPRAVYDQVKTEYLTKFGLEWMEPLGFDNTFAILVRGADARRLNLKTISDAAPYAPQWRAGFGQDFISRKDGYPGFTRTYGLRFSTQPLEMDLSLSYRALASGQVDLIAGNSTDGLIDKLDLFQLEDDRLYFPPYEAAPVFRRATVDRFPELAAAMKLLAGRITDAEMRKLNYAVDGEKRDFREVVREFLGNLASN